MHRDYATAVWDNGKPVSLQCLYSGASATEATDDPDRLSHIPGVPKSLTTCNIIIPNSATGAESRS